MGTAATALLEVECARGELARCVHCTGGAAFIIRGTSEESALEWRAYCSRCRQTTEWFAERWLAMIAWNKANIDYDVLNERYEHE